MEFKLTHKRTLKDMERLPASTIVVWAVRTCWWGLLSETYRKPGLSVPVDPRGSVLFQAELGEFFEHARKHPGHYGRHGLLALEAALHGNVVIDDETERPTSFEGWDFYNDLLDAAAKAKE